MQKKENENEFDRYEAGVRYFGKSLNMEADFLQREIRKAYQFFSSWKTGTLAERIFISGFEETMKEVNAQYKDLKREIERLILFIDGDEEVVNFVVNVAIPKK